ncbi:hypothetical protein EHE19_017670 [Ruminiclostridium herbifermentans]|uniref:Uncharacterized protein n=2 Tax=Ruminiclostridium herbifermentans TaxID=2488810 RepID=A0A4U7JI15_9FIRM|nr:hypothetical protein EHE19_017670 [Ruminiclostridium herbifermentans]
MVNSTHDANRYLGAALKHFTSGIKALADYAHARGFKLNIYVGC